MKTLEEIIYELQLAREDTLLKVIDDDWIKSVVLDNIDKIVDEISYEINTYSKYDNSFDKMFDDSLDKLDKLTIMEDK